MRTKVELGSRRAAELTTLLALALVSRAVPAVAQGGPEIGYVGNTISSTTSVVDITTNSVSATIPLRGYSPRDIAVTSDGSLVFVAARYPKAGVFVLDAAARNILTFIEGVGTASEGVAVSPDGTRAYATNFDDDSLSIINVQQLAAPPRVVPLGDQSGPARVAFLPSGQFAYVSNFTAGTVSVVDTAKVESGDPSSVLTSIPVGPAPNGLAATPDGNKVYVVNGGDGTVSVIGVASQTTIRRPIPVGTSPAAVSVASVPGRGVLAYVTNVGSGTVSVIDTEEDTVVTTISMVGEAPAAIAFAGGAQFAYVTDLATNPNGTPKNGLVSIINTATDEALSTTIPVEQFPVAIAIGPAPPATATATPTATETATPTRTPRTGARLDFSELRAADGSTYQVLRAVSAGGDAEQVRITTVAGSVDGAGSCALTGTMIGDAASAIGGVTPPLMNLHPYAQVHRTFVLTPNDIDAIAFDPSAGGRVTLGDAGGGALNVCSAAVDCTGQTNVQTLVGLDSNEGNVPPACIATGLNASCDPFNPYDVFAFGPPASGNPPVCTNPADVTVDTTVCAAPPTDGFSLNEGQAIVFVYNTSLANFPFAVAVGGFGITTDPAPTLLCPADSVVSAEAQNLFQPAPPPTPTSTPTPGTPTTTPIPPACCSSGECVNQQICDLSACGSTCSDLNPCGRCVTVTPTYTVTRTRTSSPPPTATFTSTSTVTPIPCGSSPCAEPFICVVDAASYSKPGPVVAVCCNPEQPQTCGTATPSATHTAPSTATPSRTRTVKPTSTRTATATPSATMSPLSTPSPTPTSTSCVGDCDGGGMVAINELILGVNIALGLRPVRACPAFANSQGMVDIAQLITGVNNSLNGCATQRGAVDGATGPQPAVPPVRGAQDGRAGLGRDE